jgi:hypothetical protein
MECYKGGLATAAIIPGSCDVSINVLYVDVFFFFFDTLYDTFVEV